MVGGLERTACDRGTPAGGRIKPLGIDAVIDLRDGYFRDLDLVLEVGRLEESITVDDAIPTKPRAPGQTYVFQPEDLSGCAAPIVGGNIKAPKKLKDVAPHYPESLRGSGTEAIVVMDATIGLDGFLKNIEVRDGANPEFADAAVTAVREWQFSQTILNCTPIEVQMTITTRFRPQR